MLTIATQFEDVTNVDAQCEMNTSVLLISGHTMKKDMAQEEVKPEGGMEAVDPLPSAEKDLPCELIKQHILVTFADNSKDPKSLNVDEENNMESKCSKQKTQEERKNKVPKIRKTIVKTRVTKRLVEGRRGLMEITTTLRGDPSQATLSRPLKTIVYL
uniref:S100P-binding protein n=1 Tax=Steinernema glaseri TaxID=37863 RepID=A0A1I7ZDZ0_9BILA